MGTYFGTDGIRGVAGELLTPEFAVQVGRAAAVVVAQKAGPHPLFVIGRDTRLSGPMLEAALTAGLTSGGARVEIAGVIPTPGLATLVNQRGANAGVVISASHNPFADNGIKFFTGAGVKLSDEEEAEIEAHIAHHDLQSLAGDRFGSAEYLEGAVEGYVADVLQRIPLDLAGVTIAIDCAHGAMSRAAPLALAESGADVTVLFAEPDGTNINAGCGSTHIGALQEIVAAGGFDLGLAFDGDGDRVLAVDAAGELVDGDFMIAILAKHLKAQGRLRGDTVVTTVSRRSLPCALRCFARMAIMKSPSTNSPAASTASTRSPSPSKARPRSKPSAATTSWSAPMCVEPQPALMLVPSGAAKSTVTSAPDSASASGAARDMAPWAQSMAIFMPLRSSGMRLTTSRT